MKIRDIVYFFRAGANFQVFEKLQIVEKQDSQMFSCKILRIFICSSKYGLENKVAQEDLYHKNNICYLNKLNKNKIMKVIYEEG